MSHVNAESRETSRPASSIKVETSIISRSGEAEVSSRVLRESLCWDSSEKVVPVESLPSAVQSRIKSESQWGNARMKEDRKSVV